MKGGPIGNAYVQEPGFCVTGHSTATVANIASITTTAAIIQTLTISTVTASSSTASFHKQAEYYNWTGPTH